MTFQREGCLSGLGQDLDRRERICCTRFARDVCRQMYINRDTVCGTMRALQLDQKILLGKVIGNGLDILRYGRF